MYCLQEMRWKVNGSRILQMEGRRYELWRFLKIDGIGGVGCMVTELCDLVVEGGRVSDRGVSVLKRMC